MQIRRITKRNGHGKSGCKLRAHLTNCENWICSWSTHGKKTSHVIMQPCLHCDTRTSIFMLSYMKIHCITIIFSAKQTRLILHLLVKFCSWLKRSISWHIPPLQLIMGNYYFLSASRTKLKISEREVIQYSLNVDSTKHYLCLSHAHSLCNLKRWWS